jgi:hypothetical protein
MMRPTIGAGLFIAHLSWYAAQMLFKPVFSRVHHLVHRENEAAIPVARGLRISTAGSPTLIEKRTDGRTSDDCMNLVRPRTVDAAGCLRVLVMHCDERANGKGGRTCSMSRTNCSINSWAHGS